MTQAFTQAVDHEHDIEALAANEDEGETSNAEVSEQDVDATNSDESQEDQSGESESQVDDDESEDDSDEALVPLAKLKKVRSEARRLRERLRTAEARIEELEQDTSGSEWESKYGDLLTSIKHERLERLILAKVKMRGAIEPDVINRLVPIDEVAWSEDNTPTNVDDLIERVKKDYPRLFSNAIGVTNAGALDEAFILDNVSSHQRLRNAYQKK